MAKWLPLWMLGVALLLPAGAALAQSTSKQVAKAEVLSTDLFISHQDGTRVYTANIDNCRKMIRQNTPIALKWTIGQAYQDEDLRYALKVQRPEQTCDENSADTESDASCTVIQANKKVGTKDSFSFQPLADEVFGFDDPEQCVGRDESYDVILVLPYISTIIGETTDKTHEGDVIRLKFQTIRPNAPGEVTAQAGGSSIKVSWSTPSEGTDYVVYYSTSPLTEGALPEDLTGVHRQPVSMGNDVRITSGIQQDKTYYIAVTTRDSVGNESLLSPTTSVATEETVDFWEDYLNHGGRETGGYCASMPASEGGFLAIFMMFGLLWRRSSARRTGSDA